MTSITSDIFISWKYPDQTQSKGTAVYKLKAHTKQNKQ